MTRTTEVAQLVDGRVGQAVNYDLHELRAALDRLLNDENERRRYEQKSQAFVREHFDLDGALENFQNLYQQASGATERKAA